ncbi:hypothetical protein E2320_016638, partial [Naja naja]
MVQLEETDDDDNMDDDDDDFPLCLSQLWCSQKRGTGGGGKGVLLNSMEDFTRLGYCIVAGSFVAFQFSFSALSPQLSLSLSPSYSSLPSVKQNEWNSRCVSTLHAVIVGLFCVYILWYDAAVNANPIWRYEKI